MIENLPYSLDAEQSLLGAILLEPSCVGRVMSQITDRAFYVPMHRATFRAIQRLVRSESKVDFITILDEVRKDKDFDDTTGREYLTQMAQLVPSIANVDEYARIVRSDQQKRRVIYTLEKIQENSLPYDSPDEMIAKLRQLVEAEETFLKEFSEKDLKTAYDDIGEYLTRLYEGRSSGISTGFSKLDNAIGGLRRKTITVLAARPRQGKSAFALNIGLGVARGGNKVLYLSEEMTLDQQYDRIVSKILHINSIHIRDGRLSDSVKNKIIYALDTLKNAELLRICEDIVDMDGMRRKVDLYRPDVLIIDHLGIMKYHKSKDRFAAVSERSRLIKQFAKEKQIAILELVQMNRAIESRADKTPQLSDLRETGDIEQDADAVMFIMSEKEKGKIYTGSEYVDAKIYIAKNRDGNECHIPFKWQPQYHDFSEIEPDERHGDPPPERERDKRREYYD